jgi:hypothetical protein
MKKPVVFRREADLSCPPSLQSHSQKRNIAIKMLKFYWSEDSYCHRPSMELDLQSWFGLHVILCMHTLHSCIYSLAETPQLPPTPCVWAHLRGRYWSAKIDDISLWPPAVQQLLSWSWGEFFSHFTSREKSVVLRRLTLAGPLICSLILQNVYRNIYSTVYAQVLLVGRQLLDTVQYLSLRMRSSRV